MPLKLPPPFWPRNCPRPSAAASSRWRETFLDDVKLLPIVNNATLTEVMILKLLRLILGENGQPSFERRQMKEASSLDDALKQLNSIWGTEDNFFTAYN